MASTDDRSRRFSDRSPPAERSDPAGDLQRRRNRRADSIAAAPGGAEAVFRAAVSDAGLRAIWSVVPKSAWPSDDPDHRPAALAAWSEARLFHVATAVSRIRDSAALPSSATWRPVAIESQDGSDRLSGVPVRIGSAVGGLRLDRMLRSEERRVGKEC